ncbi:ABC transporter permease [Microbacterium album]|uniref:ABC transporter permease n=1 Tax=Microbacterium album TaxID=2053191 RepID=UPI00166C6B61|nr:ABC transporter permease [Microbacterium album]
MRVAFQGLRGAPVRSTLVILTLTLGMLGFVAVISATAVMRQAVTQKAILTGGDEVTAQVAASGVRSIDVLQRTMSQLHDRADAHKVAATLEDADVGIWAGNARLDNVALTFATPSLREIRPFPLIAGQWISGQDSLAPRLVLNEAAYARLGTGVAVSAGTRETRLDAVVIGIIRDGDDQPHAYLNLTDFLRFKPTFGAVMIVLNGPTLVPEDIAGVARMLAELGAPFTPGDAIRTDQVDGLASEVATTAQVLLVLGTLALATTIVGILNIGLATARARSREFALRRTMGASRANIASIVMLESQILALIAAAVATAASVVLFPLVVGSFGDQLGIEAPLYEPWYPLVSLIVATVTAGLSTLVPAFLSYGRDLSEVMRT